MKRKQVAWLLVAAVCCCSVQANAETLRSGAPQIEARKVPAQAPAAIDKTRAERYYQLGLAALQEKDNLQALKAFREAIRADRTDARLYWERGKLYKALGDRAKEKYAYAMQLVHISEMSYFMRPQQGAQEAQKRKSHFKLAGKGPHALYNKALREYDRAEALGIGAAQAKELAWRRGAVYGGLAAHAATVLRMEREERNNFRLLDLLEPQKRSEREAWPRQDATFVDEAAARIEADFKQALACYDEALRIEPNSAAIYARRGMVYYNRGRYRLMQAGAPSGFWAQRFTRRALPENAPQVDLRDYRQAIADCRRALALQPDNGLFKLSLGQVYASAYEDAQALAAYSSAAEQAQWREQALFKRGQLYLAMGKREKAREDMQADLSKNHGSSYALAIYKRSDDLKNLAEEMGELTDKIASAPSDGRPYEQRAALWASVWKYVKAIDDYTQAEALGNQTAALYLARGRCYQAADRLNMGEKQSPAMDSQARALADYERAAALGYLAGATEEEKTSFYSSRADARFQQRRYAAAAGDLTQVIRSDKMRMGRYFSRSLCYRKLGLSHLAASDLLQILLRLSASDIEAYEQKDYAIRAYRALAELYADDLRDDAKALEAYDALLRLSPKDDDARLRRALLLDRMGEEAKAAEDFFLLQKDSKARLRERIPEKYRLPLTKAQEEEQAQKP